MYTLPSKFLIGWNPSKIKRCECCRAKIFDLFDIIDLYSSRDEDTHFLCKTKEEIINKSKNTMTFVNESEKLNILKILNIIEVLMQNYDDVCLISLSNYDDSERILQQFEKDE